MKRGGDGLDLLLRLKRHRIHEIGLEIADLNAAIQRHQTDKADIALALQDRADPTFPEAAQHTARFVLHANELLRRQERQIERLEAETGDIAARLRDAYLDLKQVELTLQKRATARRQKADAREQAESDELWSATQSTSGTPAV